MKESPRIFYFILRDPHLAMIIMQGTDEISILTFSLEQKNLLEKRKEGKFFNQLVGDGESKFFHL